MLLARGQSRISSTVSWVTARWTYGDLILRREVLGLAPLAPSFQPPPEWMGKPWMATPVFVVEDSDDALVTYIASP